MLKKRKEFKKPNNEKKQKLNLTKREKIMYKHNFIGSKEYVFLDLYKIIL